MLLLLQDTVQLNVQICDGVIELSLEAVRLLLFVIKRFVGNDKVVVRVFVTSKEKLVSGLRTL